MEYDTNKFSIDYNLAQQFANGQITIHELVNTVFQPEEQVNDAQRALLITAFEAMSGRTATPHVGTGSGGDTSNQSRWDGKRPEDFNKGGRKRR